MHRSNKLVRISSNMNYQLMTRMQRSSWKIINIKINNSRMIKKMMMSIRWISKNRMKSQMMSIWFNSHSKNQFLHLCLIKIKTLMILLNQGLMTTSIHNNLMERVDHLVVLILIEWFKKSNKKIKKQFRIKIQIRIKYQIQQEEKT